LGYYIVAEPAIITVAGTNVMSVNLVSIAQQFLTPQLIAKIASALSLDKNLIGKAITALIPGRTIPAFVPRVLLRSRSGNP
jgi:hypothetical protein